MGPCHFFSMNEEIMLIMLETFSKNSFEQKLITSDILIGELW